MRAPGAIHGAPSEIRSTPRSGVSPSSAVRSRPPQSGIFADQDCPAGNRRYLPTCRKGPGFLLARRMTDRGHLGNSAKIPAPSPVKPNWPFRLDSRRRIEPPPSGGSRRELRTRRLRTTKRRGGETAGDDRKFILDTDQRSVLPAFYVFRQTVARTRRRGAVISLPENAIRGPRP